MHTNTTLPNLVLFSSPADWLSIYCLELFFLNLGVTGEIELRTFQYKANMLSTTSPRKPTDSLFCNSTYATHAVTTYTDTGHFNLVDLPLQIAGPLICTSPRYYIHP